MKKLCTYYLGRRTTEALNKVNEVTGFLSPKCLPGKFCAVHSWTKIGDFFFFFPWSIVQDITPTRGAHWGKWKGSCVTSQSMLTSLNNRLASNAIYVIPIISAQGSGCTPKAARAQEEFG